MNLMSLILYCLTEKKFQGAMSYEQEEVVIKRKLKTLTDVYSLKLLISPSALYKIDLINPAIGYAVDWRAFL